MSQTLTIELTDDIYEAVKQMASENGLQPGEWVVSSLQRYLLKPRPGSPEAVLWAISQPPHLQPADVDELERAIKKGELPLSWEPLFEDDLETHS